MMIIRKATEADLEAVVKIYDEVHIAEENGKATIGWKRGIYPVERTAQDSLNRGDLFVQEEDDKIVGTAIINKIQVDSYEKGDWEYPAEDDKVMVLHTLIISPSAGGQGYGKAFVWIRMQKISVQGKCIVSLGIKKSELFRLRLMV